MHADVDILSSFKRNLQLTDDLYEHLLVAVVAVQGTIAIFGTVGKTLNAHAAEGAEAADTAATSRGNAIHTSSP